MPVLDTKQFFMSQSPDKRADPFHQLTDLCDFVAACRPPDDDLVDLIEQAFLEGQIDGVKRRWRIG